MEWLAEVGPTAAVGIVAILAQLKAFRHVTNGLRNSLDSNTKALEMMTKVVGRCPVNTRRK